MNPESPSKSEPTVVGIGASAGGLAALKTFFAHVPPDSGIAFVVVVHLSPDHESHLAELLQPHVRFPVEQVSKTTLLETDHVYIIPPNANLNAIDTHLRLSKLEERRQERAPIDHFFRTLANTHDGHAIAVVLTGTGSDGTLGIKDVKANGGVVFVQEPSEAEYDGMPQSAVATGMVDFVLPVAEIPGRIQRFVNVRPRLAKAGESDEVTADESVLLNKVFAQLRSRTDRDFSRYKRSTVLRRVARRMQLNYIEDLPTYVERLQERPEEVRALADDLLITVTHFFRDSEVFAKLEKVELGKLFAKKGPGESVRAWSVGCATGEEAYSLAMLLVEQAGRREAPPQIQVFASDLHGPSLDKAREGFYPGDIASDVAPERIKRFFQQENGGYRIRKEIRDLIVFAPHNLLADPPFSRVDLISCRNLLIYLDREVQQDVIELFHYALNQDGMLMLGSAETIDAFDLFRIEDKRLCFFRKRNVAPREPRLPVFPLTRLRFSGPTATPAALPGQPLVYGGLHQRLVEKYAPPSMLVGAGNRILHLSEHVGRYLVPPGGEPTMNAVRMVREELRIELQAALQHARDRREIFDSQPIAVRFNGHPSPVIIHVRPSMEREEEEFALVIFDEREALREELSTDQNGREEERLAFLQRELATAQQRLQVFFEEHESSKEEMKAANEELQSTNEELRSTMEELETSKEELQSINEELQTVNQQNRQKVEELSQLSTDLQNLLVATDIATLFLDRNLRILRFTPKLSDFFNVRVIDIGRSILDLTHRLGYADLRSDAEAVLSRLIPTERELQDDAGRWYLTRINPYRNAEDRIDGVVVTFVDVTDRKDAERMRLELLTQEKLAGEQRVLREKEMELARVARTLMVGELATSIAHEVNQPLAGVVTNGAAGLRWLDGDAPDLAEAKNSLSLIIKDGNRASAIIRRIREFVKNESSGVTEFEIQEVISETVGLMGYDLKKHGIRVQQEYGGKLPAIRGDRVQLEQVILNLLVNAIEAMAPANGQEGELLISAQLSSEDGIVVSMRDSGIGIEFAAVDKLFDAFFTTKPNGVGMGLSISRSIVQAHGGRMWATHNDGAGLTVHFSLPVGDAARP